MIVTPVDPVELGRPRGTVDGCTSFDPSCATIEVVKTVEQPSC